MKNLAILTTTDQALKSDDDALRQEVITKTLPKNFDKLMPNKEKMKDDLSIKHIAVLSYD